MKNILDIFLPYQKKFFLNDKRRKIWISSRQIGKSFTIAGILCYKSLSKKNGLSLCISTGSRAASEIIRKCEQFAEAIKVLSDGEIDYTSSFDSIKFNNGSRVLSLPSSTDGSNLRGYTGNCCDYDTKVTIQLPQGRILQMKVGIINNIMTTYYILYQIANLVNGKIYIGKHKTKHLADKYFGSGTELKKEMKIMGAENFEMTVLCYLNNQEELDLLESLVVNSEFCAREDTYNIHTGCRNPILQGKLNPMYKVPSPLTGVSRKDLKGRKLDEDHRANISAGVREMYRRHPEIKEKISKASLEMYRKHPERLKRRHLYYDTISKQVVVIHPSEWREIKDKSQYLKFDRTVLPTNEFTTKEVTIEKMRMKRSGTHWWNNGVKQVLSVECPGDGWVRGRCDNTNSGRKYSEFTRMKMSLSQLERNK